MKLNQLMLRAYCLKEINMELAFYLSSLVAVLATLRVITHTQPVHALLYLIVSLIASSCIYFSLGAYFAGALEVIVYASAIMLLFIFVVMMLNIACGSEHQEFSWLTTPTVWLGPSLLSVLLLLVLLYVIWGTDADCISGKLIAAENFGITLFGPYVIAVELASMLLLAGLVVSFHLGRVER